MTDSRIFAIASNEEGGRMTIEAASPSDGWWFVTVEVAGLRAVAQIDGDPMGIGQRIDGWIASLDADWRGWSGERVWESIEGTLRLTATHDGLGTVLLRARLARSLYLDDWVADVALWLDAGGLRALARGAARFAAR